jgi:hypothetical protein
MRFTAANEHGSANLNLLNYSDRQHTSSDVLGVDRNSDGTLDSFFVDFNYLARNTVINANAIAMAAIGPKTPDFTLTAGPGNSMIIQLTQQTGYPRYRVGVRTTTNDWDSVYTFNGGNTTFTIPTDSPSNYIVSVASVDNKGIESLFSRELMTQVKVKGLTQPDVSIELLQNKPNPFDEATTIGVRVTSSNTYKHTYISIADAVTGKEVKRIPVSLKLGINEVIYQHGYNATGTYIYTLIADGKRIQSKKMVFAN